MKYKVGDKVKVGSDLEVDVYYGFAFFVKEMKKYKTITIKEVKNGYYKVEENNWAYTDEMFEGLVEPKIECYTLDEVKEIIKAYEKGKEPVKPKTVWDLKVGDEYWISGVFGGSVKYNWQNCKIDNDMRDEGFCFLTKEEAEFELEARKVYTQLKKYSCEFRYEKENWYMLYNFFHREIDIDFEQFSKSIDLYFENQDILEKAIKEIGEDRILKYYLKVK